jgi:hypothetical protein
MRTVIVSLAICVVSTVVVGIVIADAVRPPLRPQAQAAQQTGGWSTTVFKNPH